LGCWHISQPRRGFFSFFFFVGVTGELSTLRQIMKVPNERGVALLFIACPLLSPSADLMLLNAI